MNYTLAKEIYGQPWLVDSISMQSLTVLLSHFKNGGVITPGEKCNNSLLFDIKNQNFITTESIHTPKNNNSNDKFIAVTKIDGAITKSGGDSSFGTLQMGERFEKFDKMPNVIGHILHMDSGGGGSNAVRYMREPVINSVKPVVLYGEDVVASAAYYIGSSADYIIMNSVDSKVGSIGTMVELTSTPKSAENKTTGERTVRIYADQSTEKNIEFEEAINNLNFKPIKANILNPLNEKFIKDVQLSRPNVSESQLKGGVFSAGEVLGTLVDGIGTFNDAVNKVKELSKVSKPKSGTIINQKQKVMNRDEIRAQHPEVFNAIVTEGVNAERSRVNAIMKFSSIDLEACTKMVAEGKTMDQEFIADMTMKSISNSQLKAIKTESDDTVIVEKEKEIIPKTKEEIEESNFIKESREYAGLKNQEV